MKANWKSAAWIASLALACDSSGGREGIASPTAPLTVFAGSYFVGVEDSCGAKERGHAEVVSNGSDFEFLLPRTGHLVRGTVEEGLIRFSIDFRAPCSGSGVGTARFDSKGALEGEYSGRAVGCCDPVVGQLRLEPEQERLGPTWE